MDRNEKIYSLVKSFVDAFPLRYEQTWMQHPFFQTNVHMDAVDGRLVKIDKNNVDKILRYRYALVKRALENDDENMTRFFMQFNKPYRIQILSLIKILISRIQFSKILIEQWTLTEFPHQNGVNSMIELFEHANRRYLMTCEEREVFDRLPWNLTVYRGLSPDSKTTRGLSWTLSENVAEWFANRFSRGGIVLTAEIDKSHVYAYNNGRNEEEIILNPRYLKKLR